MDETDARRILTILAAENFDHRDTGQALPAIVAVLAQEWPTFPWHHWLEELEAAAWATYTAEHPYVCAICQSRYPTAEILADHRRIYHPGSR